MQFIIILFLNRKWARELEYRLIKELWAFHDNKIAVRFQYEFHDHNDQWYRSHGNEQWEFSDEGLMKRREASINDVMINASERKFTWVKGPRPVDYPGLEELGLQKYYQLSIGILGVKPRSIATMVFVLLDSIEYGQCNKVQLTTLG